MSNIEDDIKKIINVGKVAKEVKNIGRFALYSNDAENNLLITTNFILNLTEEQFWEVQCKLLAKKIGVWLQITKEGLVEEKMSINGPVDLYFKSVNNEMLEIIGRTELYLGDVMIYTGDDRSYVGVKRTYIEMLEGLPLLKQAGRGAQLVAADVHVLAPVSEIKSDYLRPRLF